MTLTPGPTAAAPAAADWTLPGGRRFSTVLAGLAHFGGQALGFALALLVSLLVARKLGAGTETDAFFLSRRVITGVIETLNQILVVFYIPLIAADAALNSRGFRRAFARRLLVAGLGGCGLAALFILSAPWIVATLAPDFPEAGRRLATQVLAVFGAALPATMISVAFAAFLNVAGRFGAPSSIRQVPRAAIVATLLLASGALAVKAALAFTLGWYLVALVLFVLAVPVLRQHALDDHAKSELAPGSAPAAARRAALGTALVLMVLGAFASTWLETYFAAGVGPGGVTTLELGQRLGALLANTLAMALTLAVFARWSRAAGSGAAGSGAAGSGGLPAEAGRLGSTLVVGLCLLAPVQVFFFVNSGALVDALLDHGRFDAEAARAVAEAIRWMALAPLSAFVLRLVVVRIIVEPGIPVTAWVALGVVADVAAKLVLFYWLTPRLGVAGIMLGQGLAPLVPIALYLALTRRRPGFVGGFALGRSRGLPVAAALGCLGLTLGARLGPAVADAAGLGGTLAALCVPATSGLIGLAATALALRTLRVPLALD